MKKAESPAADRATDIRCAAAGDGGGIAAGTDRAGGRPSATSEAAHGAGLHRAAAAGRCGGHAYLVPRLAATSYKMGWIILVLFVPVVGLILYLLWNGDRPSKRLSLKKPVPIEEPLAQQELARTNLEKLRQTAPQWYPLAAYLSGKGFDLYRNTALRYLPTGEAYLRICSPHWILPSGSSSWSTLSWPKARYGIGCLISSAARAVRA